MLHVGDTVVVAPSLHVAVQVYVVVTPLEIALSPAMEMDTSERLVSEMTLEAVCVTPSGWDVGRIDPGFVGGELLVEDCMFIRPKGPVLDLTTGKDVVFRNCTIDMRGVDTNAWPCAGQVLTNGVDGFSSSGIKRVP